MTRGVFRKEWNRKEKKCEIACEECIGRTIWTALLFSSAIMQTDQLRRYDTCLMRILTVFHLTYHCWFHSAICLLLGRFLFGPNAVSMP